MPSRREAIFTDKALNNTLWHRRVAFVLVHNPLVGPPRYYKFDKWKKLMQFRRSRFKDCRRCYAIRVRPNTFRPPAIWK